MDEKNKQYLIYYKGADGNHGGHSVVYFVNALTPAQAILQFLLNGYPDMKAEEGTVVVEDGVSYPHPLAFVETWYKVYGEWQIRELSEEVWQRPMTEVFCGESEDGPTEITALCRKELRKKFPRSRAHAFVRYLKQGTLVTFYRRAKRSPIKIIQRYLWNGHTEKLEEWSGDYRQLLADLALEIILA